MPKSMRRAAHQATLGATSMNLMTHTLERQAAEPATGANISEIAETTSATCLATRVRQRTHDSVDVAISEARTRHASPWIPGGRNDV